MAPSLQRVRLSALLATVCISAALPAGSWQGHAHLTTTPSFHRTLLTRSALALPPHRSGFRSSDSAGDVRAARARKTAVTRAMIGSVSFGLFGALIGYQTRVRCSGSVLRTCAGSNENSIVGAAIGATVGAFLGALPIVGDTGRRRPLLRLLIGSVAGGVAGYYLSEYLTGFGTLVIPPVGVAIAFAR